MDAAVKKKRKGKNKDTKMRKRKRGIKKGIYRFRIGKMKNIKL